MVKDHIKEILKNESEHEDKLDKQTKILMQKTCMNQNGKEVIDVEKLSNFKKENFFGGIRFH